MNKKKISIWIPAPGIGDFIVRIPAIKLINKYFDIELYVSFPSSMQNFINYLIPDFSGTIFYEGNGYSKTSRDLIKKHFFDFFSILNISECKIALILVDDNSFGGFIKYWFMGLIKFCRAKRYIIKPTLNLKYLNFINIKISQDLFKIERYFNFAIIFLQSIEIYDDTKYSDYLKKDLKNNHKRKIIIAPGGKYGHQIWPYYNGLNKYLKGMGFEIILIGTDDEYQLLNAISMEGQTKLLNQPLLDICAHIEGASLVICNDSGILHLAAYLGARTVCICGPEFGRTWTGYTIDRVTGIYFKDTESKYIKKTTENHYYSLKLIKLDDVIKIIKCKLG